MSAFDFNIGASVLCEDGRCGRLLKVVIDPESREVTDLIVKRGLLLSEDRILPVEAVKETTEQEIRLSIGSDQLDSFEQYDEEAVEVPAPGWEGLGTYREGQAVRWVAEGAPYGIVFAKEMVPSVRRRLQKGVSADRTVVERGTVVKNARQAGPRGSRVGGR